MTHRINMSCIKLKSLIIVLCYMVLLALLTSFTSLFHLIQSIHMQMLRKYDQSHDGDYTNKENPKIVWLMSFPNSGNSFTTKMVRALTNTTTATNYGEEHINENGLSETIQEGIEYENGPFLVLNSKKKRLANGRFVLTKTHCGGGRCSRCSPEGNIETLSSFKNDCLTARRALNPVNSSFEIKYEKVQYDEKIVAKAIHIIRNPMDNIVSRYHLFLKSLVKDRPPKELLHGKSKEYFTNDSKGFLRWCKLQDDAYIKKNEESYGKDLYMTLALIPCHAEFYKYVQWHNAAFEVISEMEIPSLILHYEDFAMDFNRTKDKVLNFIEAEEAVMNKQKNVLFVIGKNYSSYYTDKQQSAILNALKVLCNEQALHQILPFYFSVTL